MKNNKIIAEFMGFYVYEEPYPNDMLYTLNTKREHELKYHKSWNDLMDVIDEIELTNEVIISKNWCTILSNNNVLIEMKEEETKRKATYKAVVEFIKFYNKDIANKKVEAFLSLIHKTK